MWPERTATTRGRTGSPGGLIGTSGRRSWLWISSSQSSILLFAAVEQGSSRGRGDVEIQFAVAKGIDLTNPDSFDAGSSLARRKAGRHNADQSIITGLEVPEVVGEPVLHLVWSGDADGGLTAVHIGQLVLSAEDVLDWAVLERVIYSTTALVTDLTLSIDTGLSAAPAYGDQPEPEVPVERRPQPVRKSDDES